MLVLDNPLLVTLLLAWSPASCEADRPAVASRAVADFCPAERSARLPIRIVEAGAEAGDAERRVGSCEESAGGLPLAPPGQGRPKSTGGSGAGSPTQALTTVGSSLAVVLGLFAVFAWAMRRSGRRRPAGMPGNIVETLGRCPLNARQEMQLVRVGNKLLLLSVTATTAETLTEITDPAEIDRLTSVCHRGSEGSLAESFRGVLSQLRTAPQPGYTFSAER